MVCGGIDSTIEDVFVYTIQLHIPWIVLDLCGSVLMFSYEALKAQIIHDNSVVVSVLRWVTDIDKTEAEILRFVGLVVANYLAKQLDVRETCHSNATLIWADLIDSMLVPETLKLESRSFTVKYSQTLDDSLL